MKRIISAILAGLMLTSALAACSGAPAEDTAQDTSAADTTAVETEPRETERHEIKDSLPDNLNFGGKTWSIYVSTANAFNSFVAGQEDKEGDIVNDAVWERNLKVQERLSFKMDPVAYADTYRDNHTNVSALILSGDQTFDLIMGMQTSMPQLIPQRMFVNAYDLEHIDFDQPWWANDFMNELALGNEYRYLMVSDFNTEVISRIRVNFFNKVLYQNLYGDPNELYQKVLDGKWLLDDMQELIKGAYKDVNGDGVVDSGDQLGLYCNQKLATTDAFVFGSDVEFYTRDKDGFVKLNMINDDAIALCERLNRFWYEKGVNTQANVAPSDLDKFKQGSVLFITCQMLNSGSLRDMEDDFGFLPYPKFDAEQTEYRTLVHDTAQLSCVPVSSDSIDISGAILEALSAESYRTVTTAYYESALKLKYARDDISSHMIDLMRDTMTTNFVYAYNYALNDLGLVYRTLLTNNSNDYVSAVQSRLAAGETKLAEQIKAFKGE